MKRFLLPITLLAAACPAASIDYTSLYHADDVIGQSAIDRVESYSAGPITALLPGVGSSTSAFVANDAGLAFTATQSRTDVDQPMVHTLATVGFVPLRDMYFTFDAGYRLDGPTGPDLTYVGVIFEFGGDVAPQDLSRFEHYGRLTTPVTLAFPTPPTNLLLAGHHYGFAFEAANETYPYFDGG